MAGELASAVLERKCVFVSYKKWIYYELHLRTIYINLNE